MSYNLLGGDKVTSLSLEPDSPEPHILKGQLFNDAGIPVDSSIDLNGFVENLNGKFSWGGNGRFALTAEKVQLDGNILKAYLRRKDGHMTKELQELNLAQCIYNINGHLTYLPKPPGPGPLFTPGLQLDGNIDGACFAVASDGARNRCRIAYKTSFDETIALAEVAFDGKYWGLPTEIDVYSDKFPGQNITLTFHPDDSDTRSLFFTEENGDGYIYQQNFNAAEQKWDSPTTLRASKRARPDDGAKAHRFSKFASAYYKGAGGSKILVYYVDESSNLIEIVGTQDSGDHKWYWKQSVLVQYLPAKSFLAVTQRGEETHLIYRDENLQLCMQTGSRRDSNGKANWSEPTVILKSKELLKHSPLAIASRCNGRIVTIFFVKRDGQEKTIYSVDHLPGSSLDFRPKRVGKLEPVSLLGAASFPANPLYDARQFSVSNLDGDDILVERVPKYYSQGYGGQQWVLSGGVVDTDVDYLKSRSRED
ncbi:hypothetical protein BDZ91DRAFT_849550 [Kalaharituber pfeilii]|nr:hypothetical protein BDZ91DRAFT_849550 [Kalaharituber pfeilii]